MDHTVELTNAVMGIFTIEKFKVDAAGVEIPGSRHLPVPSFRNLITNGGLDRMGDNPDWLTWAQVGSGSAPPLVTDSALVSRVAGSDTVVSSSPGTTTIAPYYTWMRKTFRFAAGVATGNLSEVGISWLTTGALFSRALILDSGGLPTTITVLADEVVDVTYEFRFVAKTDDETGSVTFTGSIGGTYDWTMRSVNVTSSSDNNGWNISFNGLSAAYIGFNDAARRAFNGVMGTITDVSPTGTAAAISVAPLAYVPGSYERKFTVTAGLSDANLAGGIRSMRARMGIGSYQWQFDPAIPKTAADILSLTVVQRWARA